MRRTYFNLYKKYTPYILILLILTMLTGICVRKKIYNEDFNKYKTDVIVIDKDNSRLSGIVKKAIKGKANVLEYKSEADSYVSLNTGKVQAVYILQEGLEKEFFNTAENNLKVLPKIVEHYGISREKMSGISVGAVFEGFGYENLHLEDYSSKYEKGEIGQNKYLDDLEKRIDKQSKTPDNLKLEFIDFKENKVLFKENIDNIILNGIILVIVVIISSQTRLKLFNNSGVKYRQMLELYDEETEKKLLKNILPIDILLINIYTIFIVMVTWLTNINGLKVEGMLMVLGIYYLLALGTYSFTFLKHYTKPKKAKDKNKKSKVK